jgi:16S rRNA (guanine527-N7)-methyltransferase
MSEALPESVTRHPNVSRESLDALKTYVQLLETWQSRINLIGPSTINSIWTRHILDALQLLPLLPKSCRSVADLGAGAGIPGLVLALAGGFETHLFESNGKKCAFLREVIRKTAASAQVHQVRLETLPATPGLPHVDCVVSRALAPLPLLLDYAFPFLAQGAIGLFHKGRDVDLELTATTKYWRFQHVKHQSTCDSHGVILEIREIGRV